VFSADACFLAWLRPVRNKHNKAREGELHKGKDETGGAKTGEANTRLVWFFVTSSLDIINKERIGLVTTT
jgi:hypothetical protein